MKMNLNYKKGKYFLYFLVWENFLKNMGQKFELFSNCDKHAKLEKSKRINKINHYPVRSLHRHSHSCH